MRRLQGRDDNGFTLIEITVAMGIIAVVITSLIALQLSSLRTVTIAKQRQAATALADQKVERLRSLPYETLSAGLNATDAGTDPWIAGGRLKAPWNERVVTSDQSHLELKQHVETVSQGNQSYTVRTYVTSPKDSSGADVVSSTDFWLTIVVEWKSTVTKGQTKSVVVRNRAVFPAGCNGTTDHPYVGPCQPFLHGQASWTTGGIKVSTNDPADRLFTGTGLTSIDLVLSGISAGAQVEQTTSAQATVTTSGTIVGASGPTGQLSNSVQSAVDPATGLSSHPAPTSVSQGSGIFKTLAGLAGSITLSPSTSDSGTSAAASSSTGVSGCSDLGGSPIVTGQACATSALSAAGTSTAVVDLAPLGGRTLGSILLASVDVPTNSAKAYVARLLSALGTHCTSTSGAGCVAAGVKRSYGTVLVGGLPTAVAGDSVPMGFSGMVKLDGFAEEATAESGVSSAALGTANRFAATRSGTMSYWNGNGYAQISLSADSPTLTYPLVPVEATYAAAGNITVAMSGDVQVSAASAERGAPANCQPDACTGKAHAGTVVATVNYLVKHGGATVASFTVQVDLGSVLVNTTYRAVPVV